MYILGDFASPHNKIASNFAPDEESHILINIEGYLVEQKIPPTNKNGVYNNINSLSQFGPNKTIFAFANNHVADTDTGVSESISISKKNGYRYVGIGQNLSEAKRPLHIVEKDQEISIINSGWSLIGCKSAKKTKSGTSPLVENLIIEKIKQEKIHNKRILVFLHWGYETEIYPLPLHREMAKKFIDNGANIVVGCHSHCIQGYEEYKNSHIFYGLGNSCFEQKFYYSGTLSFPSYCEKGLIVKWDPILNKCEAAISKYHQKEQKYFLESFQPINKISEIVDLSSFKHLTDREYTAFFKKNRIKKLLLPIFHNSDRSVEYLLNSVFLSIRTLLIELLLLVKLKKRNR